jgi:clan AA aspartic protease (TIGR02281 family)
VGDRCSCGWAKGKTLRKAIATIAFLLVAGCACWVVSSNFYLWFPDKAGALKHMTLGKDYLHQEQNDLAIQEFKQAANSDPSNAQAHRMLAKAFEAGDLPNQALAEIQVAAMLAPNDYDINDKYIALLEAQDKLEEAVAPYNRLLALHPKDADLRRGASWLYEQLGDNDKAVQLMQEAVRLNPNLSKGWYNWAALLDDMGKTDEAIKVLKQGLKVLPDSGSLYYELGLMLSGTKHPTDAVGPLNKALTLDSDYEEDAAALLAKITAAAGKPVYLVKLKKSGLTFFVDVVLNEKVRTKLVLDSGATSVEISTSLAKRLGIDLSAAPTINFQSATGDAVGHSTILKTVRIGTAKLSNVKSIVYDSPSSEGEEGLLGMSFLSHFKFTIDAEHSQLWLSTR